MFKFIYRVGNRDRTVADITGTTYTVESVLNMGAVDYIIKNPIATPVMCIEREYLLHRGWLYISNFALNNIYEVAEIERICIYRRSSIEKKNIANNNQESCDDYSYLY